MPSPEQICEMIKASIPSNEAMQANTENRLAREDKTCLNYWFPKIEAAGLPVPKTKILSFTDYATYRGLGRILDGEFPDEYGDAFMKRLAVAANEIGCPCFLRTGQTSGKHSWKDTCYLESTDDLLQHVGNLIEFSECADFIGLAWNVWVVRELLPTKPACTLPRYGDMPLCREFRCFVDGGELLCLHCYWPREAIEKGFPPDYFIAGADIANGIWTRPTEWQFNVMYDLISSLGEDERREVVRMATLAGATVGGRWSVDILDTESGFFVTDMAEMDKSWHWPDCEHGRKTKTTEV